MRLTRYRFILLYDKMQDSHLDHVLFVRGNAYNLEDTEYDGSYDSLFVSVGSRQLAQVRSLLRLTEHVNSLIEQCSKKHKKEIATVGTGLQWTGTKAQFIELVYALQAAAVINVQLPECDCPAKKRLRSLPETIGTAVYPADGNTVTDLKKSRSYHRCIKNPLILLSPLHLWFNLKVIL